MVYCDLCDRDFRTWYSYRQHKSNSSAHDYCHDCDEDFESWPALKQHYIQSSMHHFCRQCDTHFEDEIDLTSHCRREHDYCDSCDRFFRSAYGLHEHNRQCHHYCVDCRRLFGSANDLREHMNSSVHRPSDVSCPFRGCTKTFVSNSAMIAHFDNGGCRSGVDRDTVNKFMRQHDRNNVVTVPLRLLTGGDSETRYYATDRSWNGSSGTWDCVLCHGEFRTRGALDQHLASPKHQDKMYRCPLDTCAKRFTTFSALYRHVESESCGVLRFKAVRDGMDSLLGNLRRLRIQGERETDRLGQARY